MDGKTLNALKGSIRKWSRIVNGTGRDDGTRNCPLCKVFYEHTDGPLARCNGCPVSAVTKETDCYGTPYHIYTALSTSVWDDADLLPRSAAVAMRNFLRALLPAKT